mmetsp:Transcript_40425/g.52056  ORF Transcript_40425/g.52056 Transcript_40425/m.52056 type:complete len:103 (-) Transcript_40425:481-789(-)
MKLANELNIMASNKALKAMDKADNDMAMKKMKREIAEEERKQFEAKQRKIKEEKEKKLAEEKAEEELKIKKKKEEEEDIEQVKEGSKPDDWVKGLFLIKVKY